MFDSILNGIQEFVNNNVDKYLQQAFDFIIALGPVEKLVGVVGGVTIIILGVFELIKKLSKLIIVVAIIAGLWVLYKTGVFGSLIG